ncbi:MAG: hypothetical protein KKC51_08160, partial [Verrucomicrobia bacterium]|nr:hypothetical protein [Verrucomicrobiota bacterium]
RILKTRLEDQLRRLRVLHARDLREGFGGAFMPGAANSKYKGAAKDFVWQWFFPAKTLTYVPATGQRRRWHLYETQYRTALWRAVQGAKLTKRVTAHTFRHRLIRRVAHTPHPCGAFAFGEIPFAATLAA